MYKYNFIAEEVLNIIDSIPFNEEGFFSENDVEFLIDTIKIEDFNYETGASKCVIIPNKGNYVIKIPFNAIVTSCSNCIKYDELQTCDFSCPFVSFEGGAGENKDNYCELERKLYDVIKEKYSQFLSFFLPTIKICEIDNYPIYIQEKATILERKIYPVSEDSKIKVKSCKNYISAPIDWLAKCLEDMNNNLDMFNSFLNMLRDLDIANDLHSGNIGYYNNHAVIIDYAGFHEG